LRRVLSTGNGIAHLTSWWHGRIYLPAESFAVLARRLWRSIGSTSRLTPLRTRFAQDLVNEPSVSEIISILRGIREKYEVPHGVRILDGALIVAATLMNRYLAARRLLGSAIDLVGEACARCVFFLDLLSRKWRSAQDILASIVRYDRYQSDTLPYGLIGQRARR